MNPDEDLSRLVICRVIEYLDDIAPDLAHFIATGQHVSPTVDEYDPHAWAMLEAGDNNPYEPNLAELLM